MNDGLVILTVISVIFGACPRLNIIYNLTDNPVLDAYNFGVVAGMLIGGTTSILIIKSIVGQPN
jgi:uncharacterized membrane protein